MAPKVTPAAERFWSQVERVGSCWLWRGRVRFGYGRFSPDGRRGQRHHQVPAHRWVFGSVFGFLPPVVMHACDVKLCVRPLHLLPGTQADNMRDCVEKGRHAGVRKAVARRLAAY